MKIGFVGLGIMGSSMAENLINAGFNVTAWNRSQDKCEALLNKGAQIAASPRAVAEQADIVFSMMANDLAVKSVRDGSEGIIAGLKPGQGYVDMSTVGVETSITSARYCLEKEALFLEAPVAGSKKPAQDGTLTILAAGDSGLYETALPAFEVIGRKILFLGETGNGARMKLANNLVMGCMMAGLCEGMALASLSGLDLNDFLDVLDSGALANPMFRLKGPLIAVGDTVPAAFPLKHMQKDLDLALQLFKQEEQHPATAAATNELFKSALAEQLGDFDFAAVSRVIIPGT